MTNVVLVPVDVFQALCGVLADSFTKLGHPLQQVHHESLGLCSWRSCSPICKSRRALLCEVSDILDEIEDLSTVEAAEQLPLLAGEVG